ncbi:hypothetical protein N8Z33_01305 [Flavobacteriaceae bacterium]|nr:hypothetical protein [Flavobacteriaceae bacterium]
MDNLKDLDFKDIIETISEFYEQRRAENIKSHRKEFDEEIGMLERLKVQYFLLQSIMTDKNEPEKFKGRFYFGKNYLDVIANNFKVAQDLFEQGFHLQLQLILRNQFEFVNALIAFIGDDEYFLRYGREFENSKRILTPKPSNTEKSLKKILKENNPNGFKGFWKDFNLIMTTIYSELSTNAHGNIPSVSLQSLEGIKGNDSVYNKNICGVEYPLSVTIKMLKQILQYFQITGSILYIYLEKKKMLDSEVPFFEFVKFHSKSFQIITEK